MPSPEKFRESLVRFGVEPDLIRDINDGFEDLLSSSPKKERAGYFIRAMGLLDEGFGYEKRREILEYNACCTGGSRAKAAKAFAKETTGLGLAEKLEKVRGVPFMGNPVLNADGTITTGISWRVDGTYRCACTNFKDLKDLPPVSLSYCLCCSGHFCRHYETMLGVGLRTKTIVSSPLESGGKDPCVFILEIVR